MRGANTMSDEVSRAYNDHNVYILGAGFAQEAGLPLIKDFMNRMRDAGAWLEEEGGREREVEAIRRVLDFRLKAAAAAHRVPLNIENVEELFSLASASAGEGLSEDMAWAIAATLDYTRSTAPALAEHQNFPVGMLNVPNWTKPPNWKPPPAHIQQGVQSEQLKGEWYGCPPYEFYLGVMCSYFNRGGTDRRDTIITFNYDMVIEQALQSLGIAPSYDIPKAQVEFDESADWTRPETSQRHASVLKLHGSVNWHHSPPTAAELLKPVEQGGFRDILDDGIDETLLSMVNKVSICGDYGRLRTSWVGPPLLVPPTWQKTLTGPLSAIWKAAVTSLKTATRVIILGYSIPQTDQHFKYLLAAGLQDNISLRKVFFVNRALAQEETKRHLEERLFGLFRRELFDQDTITLVPTDIREFLAGPRNMGEESYRVRIGRPLNPPGCTWGTAPWTFFSPFQQGWSVA